MVETRYYTRSRVISSTRFTIQKCILQLVIVTAQIVEITGFVILELYILFYLYI